MKKFLSIAVTVISCAFLLWVGASWVDIIADNTEPNPVHRTDNIFVFLTQSQVEIIAIDAPLDPGT